MTELIGTVPYANQSKRSRSTRLSRRYEHKCVKVLQNRFLIIISCRVVHALNRGEIAKRQELVIIFNRIKTEIVHLYSIFHQAQSYSRMISKMNNSQKHAVDDTMLLHIRKLRANTSVWR